MGSLSLDQYHFNLLMSLKKTLKFPSLSNTALHKMHDQLHCEKKKGDDEIMDSFYSPVSIRHESRSINCVLKPE